MLEKARKLGVRRFCVHKGLPLGPVADYNHPRDLIKAGRNTIVFTTTPMEPATTNNQLTFRIGEVTTNPNEA